MLLYPREEGGHNLLLFIELLIFNKEFVILWLKNCPLLFILGLMGEVFMYWRPCHMSIMTLSSEAKAKYQQKLKICGLDMCLYQKPATIWKNNPREWPEVAYYNIYHYD